ncbi:hypothetical protein EAN93_27925 [Klebsiella pneumoniae]|nr:hypothetical protein EAN93_27925 [Klebsiella pneumoniae]
MYQKPRQVCDPLCRALNVMSSYTEKTGRAPDFRVAYKRLPARQRLFQHMRCNVHWAADDDQTRQWSIWPEFESVGREPIPETDEPLECGTATMWVLFDQPEYRQDLRQWLRVGQEGFFMAGAERIAHFTLVELLGREADAQPTAPADGLRPPLT